MDAPRQEVVQAPPQARQPEQELVRERSVTRLQHSGHPRERDVQKLPATNGVENFERDVPGRSQPVSGQARQSSMPVVGEDGTAISRAGIRPAR